MHMYQKNYKNEKFYYEDMELEVNPDLIITVIKACLMS